MKSRTRLAALGVAAVLAAGIGTYALSATAGGLGPQFMHGMMGGGMGPGMMMHAHGMMGEGGGPFAAAADPSSHLETLKTELAITAEQETAWSAYANTVADTVTAMRAAVEGASGGDRQAFFAAMQEQRQKSLAAVKAAADQLLASLDLTQKAKAEQILPGLAAGPAEMAAGMGMGMGGHPAMRHGFGN